MIRFMQRTDIDWATHKWNPCTGCEGPANDGKPCSYCYANRIATRFAGSKAFPNGFAPTFHPERLEERPPREPGARIFVGSMTDMGAPWCHEWLLQTLEVVRRYPQHTFIYLTKQPSGFAGIEWPGNCWVGVTMEQYRWNTSWEFAGVRARVRFVSYEPLLGKMVAPAWIDWVIVGAQTGPGAIAPKGEWIEAAEQYARDYQIPLFMKSSLRPYWDGEWRQEYPRV
mgnify:CR=1 FL=1